MAKTSKKDRNRAWCKTYRATGRREKNKAKKMAKHIARHPNDRAAAEKVKNLRPRNQGNPHPGKKGK